MQKISTILFYLIQIGLFAWVYREYACCALSDIDEHVHIALAILQQGAFPAHFLYHLGVLGFSFFYADTAVLLVGSVVVLTALTAWKLYLSEQILRTSTTPKVFYILLTMLMWQASIPIAMGSQFWFRGLFLPTIWHNPTTILSFPLSVLVFDRVLSFYLSDIKPSPFGVAILVILGVLAKPNFLFCLLPAILVVTFVRYHRHLVVVLGYWIIPAAVVVLGQYLWVYYYDYHDLTITATTQSERSSVGLGWGEAWKLHSGNIPVAILISVAMPLGVGLYYFKRLYTELWFQLLWMTLLIGLAIAFFVHENGTRLYHFNFSWQLPVISYLLHLYSWRALLSFQSEKQTYSSTIIYWASWAWLSVSFVSGVAYLCVTLLS